MIPQKYIMFNNFFFNFSSLRVNIAHVSDFINFSTFSQIFYFPFKNLKNLFFYYFLLLFNNKYAFILYIVFINIIYSLCNPNNTLYCMEDINDNVSSPESDHNSGFKKRKYDDNILIKNESIIGNEPIVPIENIQPTLTTGITINLDNAFKYVGVGIGIGSAALGGAKIIKILPPHSRASALISIAALAAAYKTTVDSIGVIYKNENSSTITDSSKDSDSILSKKIYIPKDISIDSTITYSDYSMKVKIEDDTLTLSDLKRPSTTTSLDTITGSSNVSNLDDYYKITDSHKINSVLENGDLIAIFQNNPYLKLEGILFFTLGIILYGLIALSIINILSKYGPNLKNYFKNKYILMYINLNIKYFNILTWVWIVILFFSVILCLIISYVLIDTFDIYCLQSPYNK